MKSFEIDGKKYELDMFLDNHNISLKDLKWQTVVNYNDSYSKEIIEIYDKNNNNYLSLVSIYHKGISTKSDELKEILIDDTPVYFEVATGLTFYRKGDNFSFFLESFEI